MPCHLILIALGCLAWLSARKTSAQTGGLAGREALVDLDECERLGMQAGRVAFDAACEVLSERCPASLPIETLSPPQELKLPLANLPKGALSKVNRESCYILFRESCKTAGVGSTHAPDSINRQCQTVLNEGLVKGDLKCPTYVVMITFFTLQINNFCSQYHRIAPVIKEERPIEEEVVSRGRPTSQSTIIRGLDSGTAVDGNYAANMNCTRTGHSLVDDEGRTANPWWSVDLGATRRVTRIVIENSEACCRITNFDILVGPSAPTGDGSRELSTENKTCQSGLSVEVGTFGEFYCNHTGQFVTIQVPGEREILSLCKVEVYAEVTGSAEDHGDVGPSSESTFKSGVMLNGTSKTAVQDSASAGSDDHNCPQNNKMAQVSLNAWWAVDLKSPQFIAQVRVAAASSCCNESLVNFEIHAGNTKPSNGGFQNSICHRGKMSACPETFEVDCQALGRYVSIRIPGESELLTTYELQIMG